MERPIIEGHRSRGALVARKVGMPAMEVRLYPARAERDALEVLFCENETNAERLFGLVPQEAPSERAPNDAFHARIVEGRADAVHAQARGTKAGLWHRLALEAGERTHIDLVLCPASSDFSTADVPALLA